MVCYEKKPPSHPEQARKQQREEWANLSLSRCSFAFSSSSQTARWHSTVSDEVNERTSCSIYGTHHRYPVVRGLSIMMTDVSLCHCMGNVPPSHHQEYYNEWIIYVLSFVSHTSVRIEKNPFSTRRDVAVLASHHIFSFCNFESTRKLRTTVQDQQLSIVE